jgi:EAL and modified HD-GYP domain-containing signal transduction protein
MATLLALQPCFDRQERVTAYAVGYRTRLPLDLTDATDAGSAALGAVIDALHEVGLGRVTGGLPALLRVRRESLGDAHLRRLDPTATMIVVDGAPAAYESDLVEALRSLRAAGYTIGAEQPADQMVSPAVSALASHIVLDARGLGPLPLAATLARAVATDRPLIVRNASPMTPIAGWGLAGAQSVQWVAAASVPRVAAPRTPSVNDATALRMLGTVRDPRVNDAVLEDGFKTDLGLSYELLKLVNSASVAGREVWSIGHAIRLLGRETIHQRLATIVMRSLGDRGARAELAHRSLVRGRFCELLADDAGMARARGPLFAVGFLSVLPDLLGISPDKLEEHVPLAPDVRDAIVHRADVFGTILSLVEAYETERWDGVLVRCAAEGIAPEHLAKRYLESVAWSREQLGPKRAIAA